MQSVNECFSRVKKDCFKFISSQETKTDKFKNKEDALKLAQLIQKIEKLKESPPEESEVADVRENFSRTLETSLESNPYWMNQLSQYYRLGVSPASMLHYPLSIDALTPKMIQDAAQLYLDTDNYLRMTLLPVEQYQEN